MRIKRPTERHGMSHSKEYKSWDAMVQRCTNQNNIGWKNYGGRGIKVCERWMLSFLTFYEDMGDKPTPSHTLERIDVKGDYSKENCKWATVLEQDNNKRNNKFITHGDLTLTYAQWSRRLGGNPQLVAVRIKSGWSEKDAVTVPSVKCNGTTCPRYKNAY